MLRDFWSRTSPKVKSRDEWNLLKEHGHVSFILWKGFLGFSLQGVLVTALTLFLIGVDPWTSSAVTNVGLLFLWLIGGYLAADALWHQLERRYGQ